MSLNTAKTIILVYAKNQQEVYNPYGALGSYIVSVGELLSKAGHNVWINSAPLLEVKAIREKQSVQSVSLSKKSALKRFIPKYFKRLISEYKLIRQQKHLITTIVRRCKSTDHIIEFYSFASVVGLHLSEILKANLTCLYDSPLVDEYKHFNAGKTPIFNGTITKNTLKTLKKSTSIICYSPAIKAHLINQHKALSNLAALRKTYEITLILTGKGETLEASKTLAKELNIDKYITFAGFVSEAELNDILKDSSIGIMPGSNWYGAPIKIYDYAATHLAVVAPNTPTIASTFEDGKTIALFKQDDLKSLTAAIEQFLSSDIHRKTIAKALHHLILEQHNRVKEQEFWLSCLN